MEKHVLRISHQLVEKVDKNIAILKKYGYSDKESYFEKLFDKLNKKYDFLNITAIKEFDTKEDENKYKTFNGYIEGNFKTKYEKIIVSFTDINGKEGNTFISQQYMPFLTNMIDEKITFLSDDKVLKIGVITTDKSSDNKVKENSSVVHSIKCSCLLGYQNIVMFPLKCSNGKNLEVNTSYLDINEFLEVNNNLIKTNLFNNQTQTIQRGKENEYILKYSKKPQGNEQKHFAFKAYAFLQLAFRSPSTITINNLDISIEQDSTTSVLNRYIDSLNEENKIIVDKDITSFILGNKDVALASAISYLETMPDARIAFNGKWGTGKTYLLNRFVDDYSMSLKNNRKVLLIDSWRLSSLETLIDMIMVTLLEDENYQNEDMNHQVTEVLKHLGKEAIVKILSIQTNGLSNIPVQALKQLKGLLKDKEVLDYDVALENNIFKKLYEVFNIDYIIIDELDRVMPAIAIKLLSEINYLNLSDEKYPKFIVSANFQALEEVLKHQYGTGYESGAFFDKLFDQTFDIRETQRDRLLYLLALVYQTKPVNHRLIEKLTTEYKNKTLNLNFLKFLTLRKIDWLAKEISGFKFNAKGKELVTIHILSIKVLNYSAYMYIFNEELNSDERVNLINKRYDYLDIEDIKVSLIKDFEIVEDD